MRGVFGVVSLLVVVAIVGIVASRQLKAIHAAPSAGPATTATPPASNVREQSQQLQERVTNDVAKALQQGADRNEQASEK